MSSEDKAKLQDILARLPGILEELRDLEKTTGDTAVKQAALSAALALAWVDLVEKFRSKKDNGE
jgi:hypothetical protein